MKVSSEDWRAAWFQLPQTLCKYCKCSQRHTHTHTQTLWASVWRWIHEINHRAWLFPAGFPHSAGLSEVKYHPRVSFGGSLMTSEGFIQANHHGGKFYTLSGTLPPHCMWWQSTHNANIIFLHLECFRTTFKTTCSGWRTWSWSSFPHLLSLTTSEASCSIPRQKVLFWRDKMHTIGCCWFALKLTLCKSTHTNTCTWLECSISIQAVV